MGGDCLFALLQVEDSGPILGAAEFEYAGEVEAGRISQQRKQKRAGRPTR